MAEIVKQPDIVGDTWLNSEPLKPEDLAGKVVLVDFWTYSCVNCHRTLPYLREWWEQYREKDFLLIGIHTPEFAFEKNAENVKQAIQDLGVSWPVVLDNGYVNWKNFANRYWPAKYLANRRGEIVYTHFGEGAYGETERAIQQALQEGRDTFVFPRVNDLGHAHGMVCFRPTPETYCGYHRGSLANDGGYRRDRDVRYDFLGTPGADALALDGQFFAAAEYVESRSEGTTLLLGIRATEVNIVAQAQKGAAVVEVLLNGESLTQGMRGKDIGESGALVIEKPRLYNILKAGYLVEGTLGVRAKAGNFQTYAFTFSGCT